MEPSAPGFGPFAAASKHFARRLLGIGENRLELLILEMQEERERLLRSILLALGMATLGLLAAIALTAALVVLLPVSPALVLLVMTALYGGAAAILYRRLLVLIRDWENFPATLDQLRKDHACLEQSLN